MKTKKNVTWLMTVSLMIGLGACALEESNEPTTDEAAQALKPPPGDSCEPIGFVRCSTLPEGEIEYAAPGCGYATLQSAWNTCRYLCSTNQHPGTCSGGQY